MKVSGVTHHKYLLDVKPNQHHAKFHHTEHEAGGADEIETGVGVHHTTHEDEGADEINIADLSGELADVQKPKAHTLGSHSTKAHPELTGVTASQHHVKAVSAITFNLGLATVGTKQAQALIPGNLVISLVKIYSDTAPTGASLIVDVNKNGVTIFTTQANRPTIPIDGHSDDSGTPDITTLAAGDRLSIDIDQVGSTVAGGDDLVVVVVFQ